MSNDFDDLFRRSESSGTGNGSNGNGNDVGDGYLSSENPFADLQSSGAVHYGGLMGGAMDGDATGTGIGPSTSTSTSAAFAFASPQASPSSAAGGEWGRARGGSSSSSSGSSSSSSSSKDDDNDNDKSIEHNDGEDRVLVSPYVSNPGSSTDEGEMVTDVDVDPMARSAATATGTALAIPLPADQPSQVHAGSGTSFYDDHALDPSFNPYADPHGSSSRQDGFSRAAITDDEVARGFADTDEDVLQPARTSSSVQGGGEEDEAQRGFEASDRRDDTDTRVERDAAAEDAASIRTVGLDSIHNDAASIRSQQQQQQQSLREQPIIHAIPSQSLPALSDDPSGRPTFLVTVSDPTKVGSAIDAMNLSSHTVYTIRTRTSSTQFRKQDFSVLRRFRDFLWLNERLLDNNPGVIVPPPPDKAVVGRFSQNFVETRRQALQTCLQQILNHPLLYTDPDLRTFLESDTFHTDIKHRQHASGSSSSAALSSSAIGLPSASSSTASAAASALDSLKPSFLSNLTGPRFSEFDEWFDQRRATLDALEVGLKSLTGALGACSKQRLAVCASALELAGAYTALATCELSDNVRAAVRALAEQEQRRAELGEQQARDEEQHLLAVAERYARLIASVRAALQGRIRIYVAYTRAEQHLRSLRASHEKVKAKSGRTHPELVTAGLFEINEAERRALALKKDFEDVSRRLKTSEWARFEGEKVADFRTALEAYARGLVSRQGEITNGWKEYVALLETGLGKRKGSGQGQQRATAEDTGATTGASGDAA